MIYTKSLDTQQLSMNDENRPRSRRSRKPCLRILVMIINFLFTVGGIGLLGAGVYALLAPAYLLLMLGSHLLRIIAILFIVIGSLVFLFSILGCCGAKLESKCLLGLYLLLIFVVSIMLITCLVILITREDKVKSVGADLISQGLRMNYGFNDTFTVLVDHVQTKLRCCAVWTGKAKLYDESRWYHSQPYSKDRSSLPASCCVKSRVGIYLNKLKCQDAGRSDWSMESRQFYYNVGCMDALWDRWKNYRGYIISSGAVVLVILILLFVTTFVFVCQIRKRPSSNGYTYRTSDM